MKGDHEWLKDEWLKEMSKSRNDDVNFARKFRLGWWEPQEIDDSQLQQIATSRRAAEMARTEEIMNIAYELIRRRSTRG